MITAHTAEAVREAEEPLLAAGVPLMERASFALSTAIARELRAREQPVSGARVLLLVGGGNNGGDALHAGAYLARRGCAVRAALLAPEARVHPAGLSAARRAGVQVEQVAGEDGLVSLAASHPVWVDGLTGIGASGGLRSPLAEAVEALTDRAAELRRVGSPPLIVAVDVPSGIGVDDGSLPGPVLPADLTVTMGAVKAGLVLPPAAPLAGRIEVVDLGLELGEAEAMSLEEGDAAARWPVPGTADHKYTRGVLGVAAGSATYPGAAVLTVAGALATGPGMVRYLGAPSVSAAVLGAYPEVVAGSGRVQAWVLGPGVDPDDEIRLEELAEYRDAAAEAGVPVIFDAGGLSLLHEREVKAEGPTVITPHAGELAALLTARGNDVARAEVDAAPAAHARRAAQLTGAVVLLKGSATVIAAPDGPRYVQAEATGWLATAGAGDVLAGVLGTLATAAQSTAEAGHRRVTARELADVAALAVFVHGRAARRAAGLPPHALPAAAGGPAGHPLRAGDVAAALPAVIGELLG
ncbi:bifunctional ADP-dependent NAD(P)H-hydrate dehydratase/NAD(P)H-hydrate epimerase [Bogoriella caseilytica]|uniref:Bifunctional NAD(P)H-hydrate repair enzyme n=1 Tax=Bogoriella caseilytica TaxID=56055 RepID=A0A3N2BEC4_9MICO|nr:bifunctional ADP-dependent NAD(P)H-hydrate dehydratase/NAD(P)H-hydrate epimerase [Bogoriella caseilytica]ROR73582.1 hydroxyethylthiazole kinase-like uncharacterized protein yjeF/hydroxyethylthiazole kinase-like uncharacterized protein yjeF [Bogoriella caseilytica]